MRFLVAFVACMPTWLASASDLAESVARLRETKRWIGEQEKLRRIATAMYELSADDAYGHYPLLVPDGIALPPRTPAEARLVTAASLELLSRLRKLDPALFVSAFGPQVQLPVPRSEAEIKATPNPDWAAGFAYDWAVPGEPAAYRVVLASRAVATDPKTDKPAVAIGCADGSTQRLPATVADKQVSAVHAAAAGKDDDEKDETTPDDIFTREHDGAEAGVPGKASARRAWVR